MTKEGTQETAVTLVGLTLGLLCAHNIAASPHQAMTLFLFLTGVHVWANYRAVYSLHVASINPARGFLLAKEILSIHQQKTLKGSDVITSTENFANIISASDNFSMEYVSTYV